MGNYKIKLYRDEEGDWLGCLDCLPQYITHSEDGSMSGAVEWVGYLLADLQAWAKDGTIPPIPPPDLPDGITWLIIDFATE